MKKIIFGVLVIMMTVATTANAGGFRVHGTAHFSQPGFRTDFVFRGNPYSSGYYNSGYYGGRIGIPGFGYVAPVYYQRIPVLVTKCQQVITGQGYDQYGNLVNYVAQHCWTEYQ